MNGTRVRHFVDFAVEQGFRLLRLPLIEVELEQSFKRPQIRGA